MSKHKLFLMICSFWLVGSLGLAFAQEPGTPDSAVDSEGTGEVTSISWRADYEAARAEAVAEGQPVVMDFTAQWCVACHTLDAEVLSHADVITALADFMTIRVDVTDMAAFADLLAELDVDSLPAILFIDGTGQVLAEPRISELVPVEEFLAAITVVGTTVGTVVETSADPAQ